MSPNTTSLSDQHSTNPIFFLVFEPENSFRAVESGSEGITEEDGEVRGGGDDDGREGAGSHLGHRSHRCHGAS